MQAESYHRYITHALCYKGFVLSYAVVVCDALNRLVEVSTYQEELPNTIFISGAIHIVEEGQAQEAEVLEQRVNLQSMLEALSISSTHLRIVLPSSL